MSFLLRNYFLSQVPTCCLVSILHGCPTSHSPHLKTKTRDPWSTAQHFQGHRMRQSPLWHSWKYISATFSVFLRWGCIQRNKLGELSLISEGRRECTSQWVSGPCNYYSFGQNQLSLCFYEWEMKRWPSRAGLWSPEMIKGWLKGLAQG